MSAIETNIIGTVKSVSWPVTSVPTPWNMNGTGCGPPVFTLTQNERLSSGSKSGKAMGGVTSVVSRTFL